VLPLAIACQYLKTVSRRRPQIAQTARGIEVAQFPARHLDQIGRKALGTFAIEDGLGRLVPEVPDHTRCVSLNDTVVNASVSINDTAPTAVVSAPHRYSPRRTPVRDHAGHAAK
jgi:hypothetical protein